jgi:hypothetical protein
MIRISQIKLDVKDDIRVIPKKIAKQLRLKAEDILEYNIYKESIDARRGAVKKVYTVDFKVRNEKKLLSKHKKLSLTPDLAYKPVKSGEKDLDHRPVVVGFGPAGIFAALILSEAGYRPIVFERGQAVDDRTVSVEHFWKTGELNAESNVQFGEGGAGTFSDGKLTTRIKDPRCRKVLSELVQAGAPEEILYKNKPHVGTDKLKPTVKNIRERIKALGGEVHFSKKVEKIEATHGCVSAVVLLNGERITTDIVIMAMGHSSRDTFEMLLDMGVDMQSKPFAVGVRIEHPQQMIDKVQYSQDERPEGLGAAEYRLTHQTAEGRGVYTFCMCPGGQVVASASESGRLVVNGMSEYARDAHNANSALLVSVTPQDYPDKGPLSGMYFQRELEARAFEAGGSDYSAPVQYVGDFLQGKKTDAQTIGAVCPSYEPSVAGSDFKEIFPDFLIEALKEGIIAMDGKLKGFAREDAVLTAIESRSSSPIRMHRDEQAFESMSLKGLYPCGEGAGYAGGIMSSAVDGIKVAEVIIGQYKKPV